MRKNENGHSAGLRMNRDEVLARIGGDEELLREVAELFLQDCPDVMAAIRKAVLERDAGALRESAHRLKGAAATFSAAEVVEAALRLEMMGRTGDLGGAEQVQEALVAEVALMTAELRTWVEA